MQFVLRMGYSDPGAGSQFCSMSWELLLLPRAQSSVGALGMTPGSVEGIPLLRTCCTVALSVCLSVCPWAAPMPALLPPWYFSPGLNFCLGDATDCKSVLRIDSNSEQRAVGPARAQLIQGGSVENQNFALSSRPLTEPALLWASGGALGQGLPALCCWTPALPRSQSLSWLGYQTQALLLPNPGNC